MPDPTGPDRSPPSRGETILAASGTRPGRRGGQGRRRWVAAGIGCVAVLGIAAAMLASRSGGSGGGSGGAATVTPRFASSGQRVDDAAALQAVTLALATGRAGTTSSPLAGPVPTATPGTEPRLAAALALNDPALPACIAALGGGMPLLGIDRVTYQGAAALLIVLAGPAAHMAEGIVTGPGCTLPGAGGFRTSVFVHLPG